MKIKENEKRKWKRKWNERRRERMLFGAVVKVP